MEATTYNKEGKQAGKVTLPEAVFDQPWNADLVHEVVRVMQGNARAGTAHTKVRGEVRGGGKKPWRQKGTGRARAGSRRSPIWKGGGTTFGPRVEKDYSRKLNRNTRAKALGVTLSQKLRDDEIIFLDALAFSAPKAKEAKIALAAIASIEGKGRLATKRRNAALIVLASRDEHTEKSFRNFGNILLAQAKDVNPVDLLSYKYVIVADAEAAVALLAERVLSKAGKKTEKKAVEKARNEKTAPRTVKTRAPKAKKPAKTT
jgi:large subunit ribosomal protein L4